MDIYAILNAVRHDTAPAVLATIIAVEGHAYRKSGASMLFRLADAPIGSISPGCLEADLKERLEDVWTSGTWQRVDYNMNADEDAIWGEAVGCGGKITVLLEAVQGPLKHQLLRLEERLASGQPVVLTRSFLNEHIEYGLASYITDSKLPLGHTIYRPQSRVILFGAGEDTRPLCALLIRAGFHVTVADWRTGLLSESRFPGAILTTGTPQEIASAIRISSRDYVVITSHQLMQDRAMLRAILPQEPRYIGILGSRRRIEMLFDGMNVTASRSSIHAPVGLNIGSEGPEEIAISIAAELIAVRAGRHGEQNDGGGSDENSGSIFGCRSEQTYGGAQAVPGAGAWHYAR